MTLQEFIFRRGFGVNRCRDGRSTGRTNKDCRAITVSIGIGVPSRIVDISGGGDINGDGYDDIIVGAPGWDGGEAEAAVLTRKAR